MGLVSPRSVVSSRVPPSRLTSSHQELAATGCCCPVVGQSQWSPSQARCGQVRSRCVVPSICGPQCHAVWQAGGGTGQRRGPLSPAAATQSPWYTRDPHSGCCGRQWAPSADLWPGAQMCCVGMAGGRARASPTWDVPAGCSVCCFCSRVRLLAQPPLLGLLRLVEWSRTGRQMPLWAVPTPVGDVMPGGRGGLPQKLLPPGPGTQAWPGAPSQTEAARYCISPGGKAGKAQAGPWPQVWRGPVTHTLSGSPAPRGLKPCARCVDPPPGPHFYGHHSGVLSGAGP